MLCVQRGRRQSHRSFAAAVGRAHRLADSDPHPQFAADRRRLL